MAKRKPSTRRNPAYPVDDTPAESDVLDTPELTPIHPNVATDKEPPIVDVDHVEGQPAATAVAAPPAPFRPSQIPPEVDKDKRHEWLKKNGHPNPTRLYRVTATKGNESRKPVQVEAIDESEAINKAVAILPDIKDTVRWRFVVVTIEE